MKICRTILLRQPRENREKKEKERTRKTALFKYSKRRKNKDFL